ncbi:MAG TPA: ethanolamine ammonia lyase large subunit, partial [Firmicutes bacterium]|nr:ethanolamine ammonia lyase large subunit [Bacillota bacterium]
MPLKTKLFDKIYQFKDLKELLAKANEEKSGDNLAGIAAANTAERIAAKVVLSEVTLEELYNHPVVPYDEDAVTRVIQDSIDTAIFNEIKSKTVGEFREMVLRLPGVELKRLSTGLTSEMVAAAAKLMSNLDLIYGAQKIEIPATCNTTIGKIGTLASRLQPNHPTDDLDGVMASVREGLSYGVGDAVIGLNPVDDSLENVVRILTAFKDFMNQWKIPTQNCVLAHITTQMKAIEKGAPVDLMFQSIAGSQKSNTAFGITVEMLDEGYELMKSRGSASGPNRMYFETGQGSELSSEGHHGADQVTMEARCYGLARRYHPFLLNTVVGFIGPEYLYDAKQVIRAGLEDHFMGKLTGIPMGVDACYTNHMKADQNDIENLLVLLTAANCNYFMGIPVADDVMLMYQSTSFHDIAALREITGKQPIPEFAARLEELGVLYQGKLTER